MQLFAAELSQCIKLDLQNLPREIGSITYEKRKKFLKHHSIGVQEEYQESIEDALVEETRLYDNLDGIDIMTDAKHGWRKNAKDTSVVVIEEIT